MDKLLLEKVKSKNLLNIIFNYLYNPINDNVKHAINTHIPNVPNICNHCGNFKNNCQCSNHFQSQFTSRMYRTNEYCFGCPGAILIESDFEQECPICGLVTY